MVAIPCLAVSFVMNLVAVIFVLSALVLIFIILIQKGRGGGLSSAFGGGGGGGILGSKTGDFLTWVTIVMAGVFLVLAVVMAKFYRPDGLGPKNQTTTVTESAPAAGEEAAPAVPATDSNETSEPVAPTVTPEATSEVTPEVSETNVVTPEPTPAPKETQSPVGQ